MPRKNPCPKGITVDGGIFNAGGNGVSSHALIMERAEFGVDLAARGDCVEGEILIGVIAAKPEEAEEEAAQQGECSKGS
jgi:hypothetical protein